MFTREMPTLARAMAPLRGLLGELQEAIDEAATADTDGLGGQHHLALCALTRRLHEELRAVEAMPVVNDAVAVSLAAHEAVTNARLSQLASRIDQLDASCAKLRENERNYFRFYLFYQQKCKLLRRNYDVPAKAWTDLDEEVRAATAPHLAYFDNDRQASVEARGRRARERDEADARAIEDLRTRWGEPAPTA